MNSVWNALKEYRFVWQAELFFAVATFLLYVGTAFVATGDTPPEMGWWDWFWGTILAAARVTIAGLLKPLAAWVASKGS